MAPQDQRGSGSKSAKPRSGRYRIKSSLFRQPPLVPDAQDADLNSTSIFSNSGRISTSNPSGQLPTHSTDLSSDSSIDFRRERLGLYVQNYVPPPGSQYTGLHASHKEPQPKPGPKPFDWGAWDVPEPKPDNAAENSEPVLWGGASMGDSSVQWAPTSGKGKRKNKNKGSRHQGHFLEPAVSTTKVDIQQKGVKWRTFPINGGPRIGLEDTTADCQRGFMPWEAPEMDQRLKGTDTKVVAANAPPVATNASGRNSHDTHQLYSHPRSGFHFLEPSPKPSVLEVSDDEGEDLADGEDEDEE
ncbi:hypothetical protein VE03_03303 [Pseudogymnoascus sp. 23342-1-I1]|nr:hypothetical protein VE03_03303 [Pseudogymnoascus sp. 23342-1-I1]